MPVFGCEPLVEMCGISVGGIALGGTRRDVYAVPTRQNVVQSLDPVQEGSMDRMKSIPLDR